MNKDRILPMPNFTTLGTSRQNLLRVTEVLVGSTSVS